MEEKKEKTDHLPYFESGMAIRDFCGEDRKKILKIIAANYVGNNPPAPFGFHCFHTGGIRCGENGHFQIQLDKLLPFALPGEVSLVKTMFFKEEAGEHSFFLRCFGPIFIDLNGQNVFVSGVEDEHGRREGRSLTFACKKGWNEICLRCKRTVAGFGGEFGVADPGWAWLTFYDPRPEESGKLGFIYSDPFYEKEKLLESELTWNPVTAWKDTELQKNPVERIWARNQEDVKTGKQYAYGWTSVKLSEPGSCLLKGEAVGRIVVWIDGKECFSCDAGTYFSEEIQLSSGIHNLIIRTEAEPEGAIGWKLFEGKNKESVFQLPFEICGTNSKWLYLGIFDMPQPEVEKRRERRYIRVDEPNTVIRPVLKNKLFGRWNYPLGVTMYGLTRLARLLEDKSLEDYAGAHISECIRLYEYSLWDREQYGYPEINNQLVSMSSLDDCGSFGSAMLEYYGDKMEPEVRRIAEKIADYMLHNQARRPDGAFYRIGPAGFPDATLWADDLYMSVPFLCRCYKLSGRTEYLDDAVNQFMQFKKYLYQPDKKILSHVYDFKFSTATGMAWGRGNGWCFFSLTELLEVLPENHRDRDFLLSYYRELAEGYMKLQGKYGLWHQILDDEDSYEETSCTAMFVYGLCRGVRFGWLDEAMRPIARKSAYKGFKAITERAVDYKGNVHGICRGSSYSFTPEYYKNELLWIVNDPHGIGIVLLAGIELELFDNI